MPEPDYAFLKSEEEGLQEIVRRERTGRRVSEIKDELGRTMDKYAAVFRDEEGLRTGQEIVQRLKEEAKTVAIDDKGTVFNQDLLGAMELGFLIDNAECIIAGALERKESRGAQFRTDFPERNDDEWIKHIDLQADGDGPPKVSYSEVTMTQWEPQERKY